MNIDKLTKEQKLELLSALDEKITRDKKSKLSYKPNEGQLPIHKSKSRFRYVFSGNGAGKTCLAVHEAMWAALGYNPVTKENTPVPCRVVVILDLPKKISEQWIPELQKWYSIDEKQFHKDGKPFISRIVFLNGSEILFGFHEQSPLAWESVELSFAIYDEPPPRPLFVAITRGGRIKNNPFRSLLIGTPISTPWLRTEIYDPWVKGELKDVECFRTGTQVNKSNLPEDYFDTYGQFLTEEEKKIRFEGMFFDLGSLALAHLFKRSAHIVSEPKLFRTFDPTRHPCVVAIDPHSSKPHYACLLGADRDNNLFYIKELKIKAVAREFAKKLKAWYKGFNVVDIVSDCAGNAEMTSGEGYKSFIQVLNEEGIRVRATSFDEKSDEDFIDKIRTALAIPKTPDNFGLYTPKLRIMNGCDGIIKDIENVGWIKHRDGGLKDKLDIRNTDYLACLKYALASGICLKKLDNKPQKYTKNNYGFGIKPKKLY